MDPYLERHVRLAERRGLLRGPHISVVQDAALELILIIEERLRAEDFLHRFKTSVVGADPERWFPLMFPQAVKPKEITQEEFEEIDLSEGGEWVFAPVEPEEAMKTLQEMLAEHGGTLTMDDIPVQGPDDGWVSG